MNADRLLELIQLDMHDYIQELLHAAGRDETARVVAAELGRYLREDGSWRGGIKRAKGWDGHATAWDALAAFIVKNDDGAPWWKILDYADGKPVADDVKAFFGAK